MSSLLFDRWVDVLLYLYSKDLVSDNITLSLISFDCRISTAYVSEVVDALVSKGVVNKKYIGRLCDVSLTPKGLELAKRLYDCKEMIR